MNIWYLTSEYPPDFGGGISMYIETVASMMQENKHEVTVIVRDPSGYTIEYPKKNMRVVRFEHTKGAQYQFLGYWAALAYQYAEETLDLIDRDGRSPDIIEIQDYNAIGYYILQKKYLKDPRLSDTKIVVHLHTPTFELARINQLPRYEFPTYWIGQMEKFCINAADAVVTQSDFLKNQLSSYTPNNEIEVIPLPYYVNGSVASTDEISNPQTDLLYLGRCEYRKGVIQLISAMERLWLKGHSYKLTILGGDTYFHPKAVMLGDWLKNKYRKWVDQGKLIFKETVPPDQLNNEIKKAKAVVIPSLYENYPYNCLIAMSSAVPVIVSKTGGQAEMVGEDGKNGFIFDWDIKGDFEGKVLRFFNLSHKEAAEIGMSGYRRICSLCNIESNYQKRVAFYNKVLMLENRVDYPISLTIPPKTKHLDMIQSEKSLLSIVIPYYNLGDYILESLDSALNVTYRNFEIVLVNDGSNDEKSLQVLKDIEARGDKRIRIINIENAGLANARNVGATHAQGEFVAFLDADDLINSDFYEKAIDLLNTYKNISFVYSWVEYFGARTGVWPTFNTELPYLLGMNMLTAFVVVRREDFLNFGKNRKVMEYGLEDYEGWVSMCEHGYSGISIPETLVQYRVRPESMSRQFNRNSIIYLLDKLSENHPLLYERFGAEIYNLLVANGPGYLWNNPTFPHPSVEYSNSERNLIDQSDNTLKYELMRVANSNLGRKIIKLFFKLRMNKFFK